MTTRAKFSKITAFRALTQPVIILAAALVPVSVMTTGCATAGYELKERFGIEKRDILVGRVESVAKSQGEAKEEFKDALEAFRAVVDVNAGELEANYDRLSAAYDDADSQAGAVRDRITAVKRVARDLFAEWERELGEYSDAGLRRASEAQLRDTKRRYAELSASMDAASDSMDPVLAVFKDRVLYLKHNLNARAIAAIGGETASLEDDVSRLIAEMERSIAAADAFIADMNGGA